MVFLGISSTHALRIVVKEDNTPGPPVGTQIVVAHADSTAVRFSA